MFVCKTHIHLFQTDAAQVIFYGRLAEMCHASFENFLNTQEINLKKIFSIKSSFLFYVRHYECNFIDANLQKRKMKIVKFKDEIRLGNLSAFTL